MRILTVRRALHAARIRVLGAKNEDCGVNGKSLKCQYFEKIFHLVFFLRDFELAVIFMGVYNI